MGNDSQLGKNFDEYRIEQLLGAGGMAKVYRAIDVKLKRYVALKLIAPELRENSDYARRFEHEAQSIARLEHPNIVQIYRFGEANGLFYIAMQFIEGADLRGLIADYKSTGEVMPISDILRVVQEIGAALDYAHSRNVIHRDVKPKNILVDNLGRALLTDFGLALLGDIGTQGEVLGSPSYVAPEQVVSSANAIPQSDIYSLGVTLFEMLTGEPPFAGTAALEVSMRHLSEPPPPPSHLNAALPSSIDDVVLHSLEKEPYDRYASGEELSTALQQAVADWQVSAIAKPGPMRRPSLVLLPHKVREQLQASALPSNPGDALPTRPASPNEIPTAEETRRSHQTDQPRIVSALSGMSGWRGALIFALIIFLGGAIMILALRPSPTNSSSALSSEVAALIASATTQPTAEAGSTAIATSTVTLEPTVIPRTPTLVPSVNTPVPAVPTVIPMTLNLPASTVLPPPPLFALLIARHGEDSMFVVNMSIAALPLAPLRLGDTTSAINGSQWGLDVLGTNECVVAWKNNGNPKTPDVSCIQVGAQIIRDRRNRFWKGEFNVYYHEVLVGTCNADMCSIVIQG